MFLQNIYVILVHEIILHLKASDIAVTILYFVLKMWGMHDDDCKYIFRLQMKTMSSGSVLLVLFI